MSYNAKAWNVTTLPCPDCGNMTVIGYLLIDENGSHQHTRYVCTFWPSGVVGGRLPRAKPRCGWEGWTVPGWDAEEPDEPFTPNSELEELWTRLGHDLWVTGQEGAFSRALNYLGDMTEVDKRYLAHLCDDCVMCKDLKFRQARARDER